jgi:anti-sigma factor RsiW
MNCEEARKSLDAFLDGELEPTGQLEMERHLTECVACRDAADRIATCSSIVRMNMPAYKTPPALKSKIRAALRKEDRRSFKWVTEHGPQLAYAAALVVLICALIGTWLSVSPGEEKRVIAEAISNHARSLMVSHLVDFASGDQHTLRPWFNGKLDYSPPVPDLTAAGYILIGGRVDILAQRPVGAIVYQHGKDLINLFVWPANDRKIDLDVQSELGYHFCGWNKARLNFFCISAMSAADLETFEDEVREHLNL